MKGLKAAARIHSCSWHEMHREATDLGQRLAGIGPWQGMVAISRGGLVPAAIIARVLDLRLVETVCIASYVGSAKGPIEILKAPPAAVGVGEGWLLVDDVADSGATAEAARDMLPAAHYATLYVKPAGRPYVDTWLRQVDQDVWIDFPWDRDPAKP
jgi:hypoxanthine phosphoribosyltransferase